jgi:hypothetical protein
MSTQGKLPRAAALQAMQEVTAPIIAIVLVLCAVFIPVSFLGGLAGELYRQFAVTIAVSVVISGIVALTLTPALAALILKPAHGEPWWPFARFNRFFAWVTARYTGGVGFLLRRTALGVAGFVVVLGLVFALFQRVPGSLVPAEDQTSSRDDPAARRRYPRAAGDGGGPAALIYTLSSTLSLLSALSISCRARSRPIPAFPSSRSRTGRCAMIRRRTRATWRRR